MNLLHLFKVMFISIPRLQPADCADRIRSGSAILIDVREPDEWTEGVADRAALLPLSDLNGPRALWTPFLEKAASREIVLYCRAGGRSMIAAKVLAAEGFRTANGGAFSECAAAGWPTVTPPSS
jgi:rhodanese-related sulfurtransferase